MGRRIRSAIAVGVVAGIAGLAGVAPAAWAKLPEFGKCTATESGTGGKYTDAACTVHAHSKHGVPQGGFEWHPLTGEVDEHPLSIEGALSFDTASGARIECKSAKSHDVAELVAPESTHTPLWALEECTAEGQECHSSVSVNEFEITNEDAWFEEPGEPGQPAPGWAGTLGFVKRAPAPEVGIAYLVKNHERAYPPISCMGPVETVWIGGDPKGTNTFISTVTPLDQMTTSFTERLSESAPGIQSPTKLLDKGKAGLQAFRANHWEPVALTGVWHDAVEGGEEELEIKAVS